MEPWKIGVILALIVGMGGYQYYQANTPAPPPSEPEKDPDTVKTERPFDKLQGQPAPGWNIEPKLWANTPRPINLSDLKGSVTLLEFWRTGCSHCVEAAPFMQKQIYEKFKPHGLKMVTFHSPAKHQDPNDPELDWNQVQAKIRELGIKYPVAFDTDSQLFRGKYHGFSFPSVVVLDRQGIIRYVAAGHTPEKAVTLLKTLYDMLGLKQPSTPVGATGATTVDPHAGHNHPPGVEHAPAPGDGHEGHNHPPGMGHGQAPTGHEGHNHPPGVSH